MRCVRVQRCNVTSVAALEIVLEGAAMHSQGMLTLQRAALNTAMADYKLLVYPEAAPDDTIVILHTACSSLHTAMQHLISNAHRCS